MKEIIELATRSSTKIRLSMREERFLKIRLSSEIGGGGGRGGGGDFEHSKCLNIKGFLNGKGIN